MIISCDEELPKDSNDPTRIFAVHTDGNTNPYDFTRLCGKLPILNQPHRDMERFPNYLCVATDANMIVDGFWRFTAKYDVSKYESPIIIADELPFPPYTGPVGKQPDGSCIISPRAWAKLSEAMRWLGWQEHSGHPSSMAAGNHLQEFADIYSEETGMDLETYT